MQNLVAGDGPEAMGGAMEVDRGLGQVADAATGVRKQAHAAEDFGKGLDFGTERGEYLPPVRKLVRDDQQRAGVGIVGHAIRGNRQPASGGTGTA